jgi:hypothetical protein
MQGISERKEDLWVTMEEILVKGGSAVGCIRGPVMFGLK